MKGTPQTPQEWADALEKDAIETMEKEGGTVDDIRDEHARLVEELFQERADANSHTPAIVASFRKDMLAALERVEEMATEREAAVEATLEEQAEEAPQPDIEIGDIVVNKDIEKDLEVGKFEAAPLETAA